MGKEKKFKLTPDKKKKLRVRTDRCRTADHTIGISMNQIDEDQRIAVTNFLIPICMSFLSHAEWNVFVADQSVYTSFLCLTMHKTLSIKKVS